MTRDQYQTLLFAVHGWGCLVLAALQSWWVAAALLLAAAVVGHVSSMVFNGRAMDQFREKQSKEPTP